MTETARNAPPSPLLFALEPQRALVEMASLVPIFPILDAAPRGDGHPVLVVPGFLADDDSTVVLRRFLRGRGYSAHGWRLGRNLGSGSGLARRLLERAEALQQRHGRKLSLVGWSLGGVYAREVARRAPHLVRQVITLASPFAGNGAGSNVRRIYESFTGRRAEVAGAEEVARRREPPPVPSTAIYSKTDGIVAWQSCMERPGDRTENIEVPGSHCGLGFNPLVLYAIADRLSQPEGSWQPFSRTGLRRLFYS